MLTCLNGGSERKCIVFANSRRIAPSRRESKLSMKASSLMTLFGTFGWALVELVVRGIEELNGSDRRLISKACPTGPERPREFQEVEEEESVCDIVCGV